MRALVIIAAAALAGCGATQEQTSAPIERPVKESSAPEVLYFYRVLGDDPVPDTVSLHADGTALVKRIAGRGWKDIEVTLTPAEARRVIAMAKRAPFAQLDGRTVEPGGFGGSDNGMRYLLRRDKQSVTVADGDIPRSFRALVRTMNGIVEGDVGRQGAEDKHYSASGGVAATEG
jgi:hypothetical protein